MASRPSPRTLNRRTVLRFGASLGVLGLGALHTPPLWAARRLRVGDPAPPATLVTLTGERLRSTDLLGRVVILTFWATWCAPCRKELPFLSAYAKAHAADGLSVLGFSLNDREDRAEVASVAADFGFPVGLLADSDCTDYGRIWRMPANFTIDRQGRLADNAWEDRDAGWSEARLQRLVTPLLHRI
jgi:peroxiredoxin